MLRALSLSIVVMLCLGLASNAIAQEGKIATCNPARIFNEMQETKDLKEKMEVQGKALQGEEDAKKKEIDALGAKLKLLNPGTAQHDEAQRDLLKKAIEHDTWKKINQAQVQQEQKLSMKLLFDKITAATKAVAEADGIDLVIAEANVEFPDVSQINVDQLRALINQRNVMYNKGTRDISGKIIAKLDADYKTGGAAAPAK
jgi:Skp family chaperone for outer membrane proteins